MSASVLLHTFSKPIAHNSLNVTALQVRDWVKRYGADDAKRLMEWNNNAAASYARVNRLCAQPDAVLARWESEGVRAEVCGLFSRMCTSQ